MMPNPARLAELQAEEFPARCKVWGLKPGPIRLIHDDFLQNTEIGEVLKKADVILINNQAFTAELNNSLKLRFLDLKEGAQIVSLKYYRDPLHRIKESNINDSVNVLKVKEKERFSGMVSWTDDPGKWYLHTKDTTELKRFQQDREAESNGA
jgi:[histone H3]-lysine79 N-trimethyltransferase